MNNITAKLPIRSSFEAVTQMIIAVASAHDLYKIQTTPYSYSLLLGAIVLIGMKYEL